LSTDASTVNNNTDRPMPCWSLFMSLKALNFRTIWKNCSA